MHPQQLPYANSPASYSLPNVSLCNEVTKLAGVSDGLAARATVNRLKEAMAQNKDADFTVRILVVG